MNTDIDRLVATIAPDPGPGMTPGARELLEEITTAAAAEPEASPAPRRSGMWRRWLPSARERRPNSRWRLVMPLAAITIVLSWVVPGGIGAGPASAALDIRQRGEFYVVTVKDLYANPKRYQNELSSRGLKVTIALVATDSTRVGRLLFLGAEDLTTMNSKVSHVIPPSDDIFALEGDKPCPSPQGCPVGVKIRVGYKGPGEIVLGRPALPGDAYRAPPALISPGQPLHCIDFINDKVPEVVRLLREHGIDKVQFATYHGMRTSVPDSWYVHDGVMSATDRALILVDPAPHPHPMNVSEACRW